MRVAAQGHLAGHRNVAYAPGSQSDTDTIEVTIAKPAAGTIFWCGTHPAHARGYRFYRTLSASPLSEGLIDRT